MQETKVLLVEDTKIDSLLIQSHLRHDERFLVDHVETLADACDALRSGHGTDVVVLDLNLPDSGGADTFNVMYALFPDTPIVILSGTEDEQLALDAVAQGAQDYVPKAQVNPQILSRSLRYAIERNGRLLAERQNLIFERDIGIARKIQRHLLPSSPPAIPGFDIAGACQPADACGGDFLDFIPVKQDLSEAGETQNWDLLVADVSSHGFGPALTMVGTRRMLRVCATLYDDLGEILTIANKAVAEDTLDEQFVTLFYAR